MFCCEQGWQQAEAAKFSMKRSASTSHGELYFVVRNGSGLFSCLLFSSKGGGEEMRPWNGEKAEPELRLRLLMIRLGAVDAADECRLERLIPLLS